MDASTLIEKYDRPVPRYTSYPTAVHFNHEISQDYYASLLSELKSDEEVSLYLHIPFCHALCHYCGCHTKVVNSYTPVKAYVQTLLQEIDLVGNALSQKPKISHLHFGGGSPNFLKPEDMGAILDALRQYFDLKRGPEIAIETDPRLLDSNNIEALARMGFTRVSLGVQDFDPVVQEAVNRVQPFEGVHEGILHLRDAGIKNINFDLMVGLPLQTLDTVQESVNRAISLLPDRLAVFAYAHVPWMQKHQKLLEKYDLPQAKLRFDMIRYIKERLENAGYHSIGIDHFARERDSLYKAYEGGTLRRNFQGYTDDQAETLIGLGISSISAFKSAYAQNTTSAPDYRRAIEAGEFPIKRGRILDDEDVRRRRLITTMMCGYEVDVTDYPEACEQLKQLEQDRLVEINNGTVKITNNGWPFARIAASCFDTYYQPQEGQHAKVI